MAIACGFRNSDGGLGFIETGRDGQYQKLLNGPVLGFY